MTFALQEVPPLESAGPTPATTGPRPAGQVTHGDLGPVVLDPAMQRLYDVAGRIARGSIGVLVIGETGTGKEVLAEYVHRTSSRAGGPLVRINCAALNDSLVESELFGYERGAFTGAERERRGLLESAHGGTAFLDEIGELPAAIQAKLLRVLEGGTLLRVGSSVPRSIDVRFVAATNRDLGADVAAGRFRRDLYFRLAGAVLAIPPLRERRDEIEPLARRFALDAGRRLGLVGVSLGEAAIARLRTHTWPGNIRELRNAIERALLIADGGTIDASHLPFDGGEGSNTAVTGAEALMDPAAPLGDQLAELERKCILHALDRCGGNQTRAAELLGMPRRTLVKRLARYGLPRPRKR